MTSPMGRRLFGLTSIGVNVVVPARAVRPRSRRATGRGVQPRGSRYFNCNRSRARREDKGQHEPAREERFANDRLPWARAWMAMNRLDMRLRVLGDPEWTWSRWCPSSIHAQPVAWLRENVDQITLLSEKKSRKRGRR